MRTKINWKEKMVFQAEADGQAIVIDAKAPIGSSSAMTPKELVAIAISGCTAMDIVALLKKNKQALESFEVIAEVKVTQGVHPAVFESVALTMSLTGKIDKEKALEAARLSQTKYCSVSAMLAVAVPIEYQVILNGESIGRGEAHFSNEAA